MNDLPNQPAANDEKYGKRPFQIDEVKFRRFVTVLVFVLVFFWLL
jgi:hypothetical protein